MAPPSWRATTKLLQPVVDQRARARTTRRAVFAILGCALGAMGLPVVASATVAINSFGAIPSTAHAGAHPDFNVEFLITSRQGEPQPTAAACGCTDVKNLDFHLPAGLIGSPEAAPQCNIASFSADRCPVDSQVGVVKVGVGINDNVIPETGEYVPITTPFLSPVFNLSPPPDVPGLLGFKSGLLNSPTFEVISARTDSDYGLDVSVDSIEHVFPVEEAQQITWGVPAAPIHDNFRFGFQQSPITAINLSQSPPPLLCDANGNPFTGNPINAVERCQIEGVPAGSVGEMGAEDYPGHAVPGPGHPVSSNSPETPFLQGPTTCDNSSLSSNLDLLAYDGGETHAASPWPTTSDCAQLTFNPSQAISPTTEAADSPSGAEFRLTVPQFESPSVPSPSELRGATVTLPEGFALAPNVMNGKTTCSGAEARFGTTTEANCPENAKIGTITVETPVLPGPLPGAAYLGEPLPGNRYRIFLTFDGFGVHVKLAGTITPDPTTGQIHIAFQDLPQAPFETFNLHIFGSERGPLATPTQCGTYPVESVFTPWDSALSDQTSRQFFTISEGPGGKPCPNGSRPFTPAFQSASQSSTAGAHTAFSLNLTRDDGDQNIAGLTVSTPPGFSATLKGIPYCSQSAIDQLADPLYPGVDELSSPLCAASLLGTVTAGVGAGTHPLYLPGKVYLAGPYKGAPLSLEIVIPAVAGPYDLGNVAVRAALRVNPETAQVTTVSDPVPQIFGGIPIRARQILVDLNRENFALNPTNCNPFAVNATLRGDEGASANLSSHFQVANCTRLSYAPKLSLRLTGGLNRLGHPAIHSVLQTAPGEANTASVSVALPKGEILDNSHIKDPCTRAELNAESCPPGSVLGHARASTPLLDQPLEGPVYLTTGFGHTLPDLVADLHGQIHIILDGKVDTVSGGSLRTIFQTVPDAPVSTFTLDLLGGSKGLVQNSESLCGASKKTQVKMTGQNGRTLSRNLPLQAACGKNARHKRHHSQARRNRGASR